MAYGSRESRGSRGDSRHSRDSGDRHGGGGGDFPMASPDMARKVFFRRRRSCPLSGKNAPRVDYKDLRLLGRFLSERGKIMPRRITSISAKKQRVLASAVKQARMLALLPFAEK